MGREDAMVSTCANPECSAPFLYLRSGQLFVFPPDRPGCRIECYWLCDDCAARFALSRDIDTGGIHLLDIHCEHGSINPRMATRANRLGSGYA